MRFSSVFQLPAVPQQVAAPVREPARAEATSEEPPSQPPVAAQSLTPGQDLPDDLDARVRLVGEWQLGE